MTVRYAGTGEAPDCTVLTIHGDWVQNLSGAGAVETQPGVHDLEWDPARLPSGIYIIRGINDSGFEATTMLTLVPPAGH